VITSRENQYQKLFDGLSGIGLCDDEIERVVGNLVDRNNWKEFEGAGPGRRPGEGVDSGRQFPRL
jgi:hypothetical protein